jgi:hypothetical protein
VQVHSRRDDLKLELRVVADRLEHRAHQAEFRARARDEADAAAFV